jgi:regulator of RNase E activity RraB
MYIAQCLVALMALSAVEGAALSVDCVVCVRWFETADTIVVAALTKPLYTRSEIKDAKAQIACAVREQNNGKRVLVCFDLDVYAKIKADLTDQTKEELIAQIESRNYSY